MVEAEALVRAIYAIAEQIKLPDGPVLLQIGDTRSQPLTRTPIY